MPGLPRSLSDGAGRVERSELATILGELGGQLAEQGFTPDVAVALPLPNTIGGALRFLALLNARQSVLLLPDSGAQAPRLCARILAPDGPLDRLT